MMFNLILLYLMLFISVNGTVIKTTSGPVMGKLVHDEATYYSYQGIPYAENPTGDLRFKPPVPKVPWTEVLDATNDGPVCPQAEGKYTRNQMSEDCLILNVYVPAYNIEKLPILVYVHGGEFKALSGNSDVIYGPQLLLRQNIIVITMNYRLGALGFLSFESNEATGNAGIKDVLLALKWVQENAKVFGGDPDRITLGGNSAGAALAHYLTLSAKSTGLFQQAILISGSATGYRFLAKHPKDNALALAKQLNLDSSDENEIIENLRQLDAFDIVQAQEDMGTNNTRNGIRPFAPFVPCIEIENESAIINKDPLEIIKSGIPQNVPILAGFNAQEGIKMIPPITANPKLEEYLNENFELCIPSNIEYPYGSHESKKLARSIRHYYFDHADISNGTLHNFVDLVRDSQFSYSIDSWIKHHKERSDSNDLYYYVFSFDGELNWFKITNNLDFPGTSHADELGYIFLTNATKSKLETIDSRNQRMLNVMSTVLTDFVKFGNPTPECSALGVVWPECGCERNHLHMNDEPESRNGPPIPDHMEFWRRVYEKYSDYFESGGVLERKSVP